MYSGLVDTVTNAETWVSDFFEIIDDDTGAVVNILNGSIGFSATVSIREVDSNCLLLSGTTSNGTIVVSQNDASEAGFQWTFSASQMGALCAPRKYNCYVTIVENGITRDLIAGSLEVLQGNSQP